MRKSFRYEKTLLGWRFTFERTPGFTMSYAELDGWYNAVRVRSFRVAVINVQRGLC